jgi:hypothetical protein
MFIAVVFAPPPPLCGTFPTRWEKAPEVRCGSLRLSEGLGLDLVQDLELGDLRLDEILAVVLA